MSIYVILKNGGKENSPDSLNVMVNYHKKRVRVNYHYFVVMENG